MAPYLPEEVRWEQAYAEWLGEIAHWTEWRGTTAHNVAPGRAIKDHNKCKYNGDGRRVQASISTRVRSASERLERLRAEPVPKPPDPLRLNAPLRAAVRDGTVLELREVQVGERLCAEELVVAAGQRLLVTGPNGAGKSTLLDVLAGVLTPDRGTVAQHGVVGYLPQETVVRHPRRTVLEAFAEGRPDNHAERLASLGLFREADFGTPVGGNGGSARCPVASAPGCWRGSRTCCCWTSRPTTCRSRWWRSWRPRSRTIPVPWSWCRTTDRCASAGRAGN